MNYGRIDITSSLVKPDWRSNAEIIAAFKAARVASDADTGTGLTTRNVMAAIREVARTIEPQLLTEATPQGLLAYARARRLKCKHLQGDTEGNWMCRKRGGLAVTRGGIQSCPLMTDATRGQDCPMYKRMAWSSQLQHLSALSSAFDWIRAQGAIDTNPAIDARRQFLYETKAARILEEQDETGRQLANDELARLLACSPAYLQRLLSVAAKAGLRVGEALALRIQDVDMEKRTFRIPSPNPYCNKRRGLRIVHMDAELYGIIRKQIERRRAKPGVDALFTNRYGDAFSRQSGKQDVNVALQRAAVRAGIQSEDADEADRVTFHCMRRWFTNQLATGDLGGVALGVQLLLRGDKLPGALSRYLDQPALAEPLWREHMPRLPSVMQGTALPTHG